MNHLPDDNDVQDEIEHNPYEVVPGEPTPFRVTYFSAWARPQHIENLTLEGKIQAVQDGRERQYKVIVSVMDEDAPETWE